MNGFIYFQNNKKLEIFLTHLAQ